MIQVRNACETDAAAWQDFLSRTASGDFLHDWEWAQVAAFDGQPQQRFVAEEDGMLVAIAAAQVRRLPLGKSFWYVPHGPVMDYTDARAGERLRVMAAALRDAARFAGALAVKLEPRVPAGSAAARLFTGLGLRAEVATLQVAQTRIVPLDDDESLLAGFDKDTRYAVRRAEREGVEVRVISDAADDAPVDRLHELVVETQRRAGFPMPSRSRYRLVWHALGGAGRARIFEAWLADRLLASGMLVVEGDRSFYLFAGSRREERGEPKRYATYALQWAMIRDARAQGARHHDLWGVAPPGAGTAHRWYGVGLFKKGFGGEEVVWAGTWDVVVDATLYRLRTAVGMLRGWAARLRR
ncbi:MAG TPA: peptidoglycan bridge formation glycyltransferase FemA/FemB family protein [Candidatus Limnocylindria bacterium]|nr:peptidoglycan bridge formation glycyltransferase FemA/FemB family protein [Candidatus Limnocylindria bacterium]